ncbi:MAG: AAA family ATPase [Pseudomonadota bacterium]|nr:AAA family ATPase [Pseudomonadota bacterium]
MLTRLKVKGFKSLEDIEVRFGPFTCVAGVNGVGKSNLFDAIMFLRDLADTSIIDAATRIRNSDRRRINLSALFTRTAAGQATLMEFDADFLVGDRVVDDFGREARPKVTFLHYRLGLRYVSPAGSKPEGIELAYETLDFIQKGDAKRRLGFAVTQEFFDSVYQGSSRNDFIYMDKENPAIAKVRQDGGSSGQPISIPIDKAERTILSNINTIDRPTALAARREMQSWINLQLESSSLRKPDDFSAVSRVSSTGEHLPATLDRLKKFDEVAAQLANLLPDIKSLTVDIDERRELKTLYLETVGGIHHEARALSDGTLRFLALAIIGADPDAGGVICLEEPENGIHPARIPAIVELLGEMAVDPEYAIGPDNPLRQIIINTHSPLVIQKLQTENIIVSQGYDRDGASLSLFCPILGTWRTKSATQGDEASVTFGALLDYLGPSEESESVPGKESVAQLFQLEIDCR